MSIIGTIFSYVVGASGGNFSLLRRSSSDARSGYRLDNLCPGSKLMGCNENVLVYTSTKTYLGDVIPDR